MEDESYAYDAYGNLTTPVTSGDSSATGGQANANRTLIRQFGRSHHEYDETGRLVRTVRRTLDGRHKTWDYTWDSQDQLVEAATPDHGTWRYSYDPIGHRTGKYRLGDDGTVTEQIHFTWDGMRVAERLTRDDDGALVALTWDYDPGSFQPAAQRQRSWAADADQSRIDETFHAIVTDLIGTPTELVTPDGRIAWRTSTTLWCRTISSNYLTKGTAIQGVNKGSDLPRLPPDGGQCGRSSPLGTAAPRRHRSDKGVRCRTRRLSGSRCPGKPLLSAQETLAAHRWNADTERSF